MQSEKATDLDIASSKFTDFRKRLSLQDIHIFRIFAEYVVFPTQERKKKLSDVMRLAGENHQSSITKSLKRINDVGVNVLSSELIWKIDGNYDISPIGRKFYNSVKIIDESVDEYQNSVGKSKRNPTIRIGLNSFSYNTLASIENRMVSSIPFTNFDIDVVHMRTAEIFDEVKHNKSVDFGICESVVNADSGRQLDVIRYSSSKICLFSNFPVYKSDRPILDSLFGKSGDIDIETLTKLPIIIGDTRSFIDYLLKVSLKIHGYKEDYVDFADYQTCIRIIENTYDVKMTQSSIILLIDILFMNR
ncbi:MAG: hypothetical protein RLP12_01975, partial [Ekhidna sp.]